MSEPSPHASIAKGGTVVHSSEVAQCLRRLVAGDLSARGRIIKLCADRLRVLASRMLAGFPNVRRWDDTDDLFQNAAMRLHRTLGKVTITSPREVIALAATELHRELLDLARRHAGPMSFAANHATNFPEQQGSDGLPVPRVVSESPAADERLDRWSEFHEAIAALPDDLREIFHLAWYLGVDQRSIAELMNCSERTVRSRWLEARRAVWAAVDGQRPD